MKVCNISSTNLRVFEINPMFMKKYLPRYIIMVLSLIAIKTSTFNYQSRQEDHGPRRSPDIIMNNVF